jgi:hypothetical protein
LVYARTGERRLGEVERDERDVWRGDAQAV